MPPSWIANVSYVMLNKIIWSLYWFYTFELKKYGIYETLLSFEHTEKNTVNLMKIFLIPLYASVNHKNLAMPVWRRILLSQCIKLDQANISYKEQDRAIKCT